MWPEFSEVRCLPPVAHRISEKYGDHEDELLLFLSQMKKAALLDLFGVIWAIDYWNLANLSSKRRIGGRAPFLQSHRVL